MCGIEPKYLDDVPILHLLQWRSAAELRQFLSNSRGQGGAKESDGDTVRCERSSNEHYSAEP